MSNRLVIALYMAIKELGGEDKILAIVGDLFDASKEKETIRKLNDWLDEIKE